jgi:hypothetical protein
VIRPTALASVAGALQACSVDDLRESLGCCAVEYGLTRAVGKHPSGSKIVTEASMPDIQKVQINTQRIPVGSSIGAALLIVILLVGLFFDLPGVRGTALGGGAIGLLLAATLIAWRRRNAGRPPRATLGITAK